MEGVWEPALEARLSAADAFAASGLPGDAAVERLAVAAHLRSAASFTAALGLLEIVHREADEADQLDLRARALGLEGNVRARAGQYEAGLALVRDGLSLALGHNLVGPAAEVYQRLGDTLEHAGQYLQARETYLVAADFCRTRDQSALSLLCLACMTVVLRQIGEWDRVIQVCRDVLDSDAGSLHPRAAATGILGSVYAFRGDGRRARPLLRESATLAHLIELVAMEIFNDWSFALVEQLAGEDDAADGHCQALLRRWERTEERHYAISPLRWATTFFARRGATAEAGACASALSRIAADTGTSRRWPALRTRSARRCCSRVTRSRRPASSSTPLPSCARSRCRSTLPRPISGLAWPSAGPAAATAVEHLNDAYRLARKLGARPLIVEASREWRRWASGQSDVRAAGDS